MLSTKMRSHPASLEILPQYPLCLSRIIPVLTRIFFQQCIVRSSSLVLMSHRLNYLSPPPLGRGWGWALIAAAI